MAGSYTLSVESEPAEQDTAFIRTQLNEFNWSRVENDHYQPLAVFLRAAGSSIAGGLVGNTYWGWLHVSILWVAADLRQHGYGRTLLQAAEQEALRRGCHAAHLDTMSFHGALPFYQRQGYTVFGELHDLPTGHTRYFLQKTLVPAPAD